ncbi:hypothetical protein [Paracidovorax citrulli]|nr:hypothetical protein [Paracidovorax citrulli]REG71476.1 hypothetical protein C8E07_4729 [Paracidovorax citrulli]RLJ96029.1 hypothetical protein C8E06_4724 [Paracidovorax citrulli]UEG46774.1 hypothetical protein LKW27_02540 [Paracidovorax citrulli]WIY29910.1 hypothetical protein QRO09_23325 [Paracidovorax citrulli]WIY39130.1 hypothetical protein QRO10_23520 [Paracidovorax citrulli]
MAMMQFELNLRSASLCFLVLLHAGASAQQPMKAAPPSRSIGPLGAITLPRAVEPAPGSDADCSDRAIDEQRIRYFWDHAVEGPASDFQRDFDLADCTASPRLHLRKGGHGVLHLHDATGWGVLEWKGATRYFRCAPCEGILAPGFVGGTAK